MAKEQNKRATADPKNDDDTCFQHVIRVARNHERIKTDPKSIKRKASILRKSVWVERHRFPRTLKELENVYNKKHFNHSYFFVYSPQKERDKASKHSKI